LFSGRVTGTVRRVRDTCQGKRLRNGTSFARAGYDVQMKRLAIPLVAVLCVGAPSSAAVVRPCAPQVSRGVLPVWARTGFSDPKPRIAHALGRSGRVAAILFADPLYAPPRVHRNNKILWVARTPLSAPSDLRISAQRMDGSRRVGGAVKRRVAGGPGPSIVDLPVAGCWRLTLHWARTSDQLDLRYVARSQ
jgi:hypothetical protein